MYREVTGNLSRNGKIFVNCLENSVGIVQGLELFFTYSKKRERSLYHLHGNPAENNCEKNHGATKNTTHSLFEKILVTNSTRR